MLVTEERGLSGALCGPVCQKRQRLPPPTTRPFSTTTRLLQRQETETQTFPLAAPPPKKKKERIKTVRVVEVAVCTLSLCCVTLTDSRWDPVSAAVDKRSIDPAVDVSMALTR